jgi:predicted transcriptional regulator of viral defense system
MTTESITDRVLRLVGEAGLLRPRDLAAHGIPRTYLQRLHQRGLVERVARGLYKLPGVVLTEKHSLAEACKRVPQGVVCLLSALRFHDLTTQNPFEVWMAIEQKAWRPKKGNPPLRMVFFSGQAFTEGVEEHFIEGVQVPVYGAAKTVADCFKFRNKIGLDVAVEALRDFRHQHPKNLGEVWRFAEIDRVARVIRPYLEAMA